MTAASRAPVRRRALLAAAASCAAPTVFAQADSTIRLVIPFPAGGVLDAMARMLGRRLATALGQPVIIDNKPGAGGNIGTEYVVRSAPTGNTLVISGVSLVSSALLQPLTYSPTKDLAPVAMLASTPGSLVAWPGVPFRTVPEFIAYAKANPKKLSYATAGNGSLGHLIGSWINLAAGIDMVHVPYRGGAAASIDVIAGRVPLWIDIASNREMIAAGKVRAIAVTSRQRTPVLPDVPTLSESGIPVDGYTWWALMAPAATPQPVVEKLSSAVAGIIRSPEGRQDLQRLNVDPDFRPAGELVAFMRSEEEKWSRVVREAGIKGE